MESPESLRKNAEKRMQNVKTEAELRSFEIEYFGRKQGKLNALLRSISSLPERERAKAGREANGARGYIEKRIEEKRMRLKKETIDKILKNEKIDITRPGEKKTVGHLHPLTQIRRETEEIFTSMGFEIILGPYVENEYYNFDALNIPDNHPSRDLQDTFWIKNANVASERRKKNNILLRTHTSPVQIRYMEKHQPPFRIASPGDVFRYEATDSSHDSQFMQIECLMVDTNISVANLKSILEVFLNKMFSSRLEIRLRPSYFPFVEPGFEVDIREEGGDWMEVLGAGMVHQEVFKSAGYVPGRWQGFAFGIGLDRIAMMKYKIPDIRLFRSGDLRFIQQF